MQTSQMSADYGVSSDVQSPLCKRCAKKAPRLPLAHPETDSIDRRIQALLDLGSLSDPETGRLLGIRPDLKRADRLLALMLRGGPLPRVLLVPYSWDDWSASDAPALRGSRINVMAGWVLNKVAAYVHQLERRYLDRELWGSEWGAINDI